MLETETLQLARFIFVEPPKIALNRHELETISAQRRAFSIVYTADLQPEWRTNDELLTLEQADLALIYVLYEFVGDTFEHLQHLRCRVIGPLVVLQSHAHSLQFPTRIIPTWSQSLYGKIVTGVSFNVDDERDIQDKVVRLGGKCKKTVSPQSEIIVVSVFNPDDRWFLEAVEHQTLIVRKDWLDHVYESAIKLDEDFDKFFDANFVRQFQVPETSMVTVVEKLGISVNEGPVVVNEQESVVISAERSPIISQQELVTTPEEMSITINEVEPTTVITEEPLTLDSEQSSRFKTLNPPLSPIQPTSSTFDLTALSLKTCTLQQITRSDSPEYVSQGPVLASSSESSATQVQAVVWTDIHDRTSQMASKFHRAQVSHLNQYRSEEGHNTAESDDVYLDEEERQLLAMLSERS